MKKNIILLLGILVFLNGYGQKKYKVFFQDKNEYRIKNKEILIGHSKKKVAYFYDKNDLLICRVTTSFDKSNEIWEDSMSISYDKKLNIAKVKFSSRKMTQKNSKSYYNIKFYNNLHFEKGLVTKIKETNDVSGSKHYYEYNIVYNNDKFPIKIKKFEGNKVISEYTYKYTAKQLSEFLEKENSYTRKFQYYWQSNILDSINVSDSKDTIFNKTFMYVFNYENKNISKVVDRSHYGGNSTIEYKYDVNGFLIKKINNDDTGAQTENYEYEKGNGNAFIFEREYDKVLENIIKVK